jgi:multidrug efflux pump subunit AcrA (membrane-fusion protein)
MKARKLIPLLVLTLAIAGGAASLLAGCGRGSSAGGKEAQKALFTCGMHPQVVQPTPGNCPICGMKLTPIRKQAETAKGSPATPSGEPQTIAIDSVTTQNMGIRTAVVTRGPLRRTIRTVGAIDYNETSLEDVTTKFKGWIEKLYVDATGQQVHRGDPLFEIYSPELYSAQREYLLAVEQGTNAPGDASLKNSALTKLRFLDISPGQIAELERTGQPTKTLRILSPMDGFVLEKMVVQGQMVDPGMKIYRLADLGLVWVQAQIYEQDLSYLKLGQEATVTLSYLPDREFRGRVTYIYPNVDEKTRTARVRMEFHNPGYFLKPGMFATVQVFSELDPSVLLVPDMAVLRSGEKNTVFVALAEGKFEARTITLGPQAENGMYQVISGLKEGERIVTSGQFMLDSESQLREAIQKMTEPKKPGQTEPATHAGREGVVAADTAAASSTVKYICPMPEHVSIQYDHPGKCSICGMTLVPVSGAALKKLQPGGQLLYYSCPMPEDSDVRSDKPGKCPKCSMTLIPVMESPPLSMPASIRTAVVAALSLYFS